MFSGEVVIRLSPSLPQALRPSAPDPFNLSVSRAATVKSEEINKSLDPGCTEGLRD